MKVSAFGFENFPIGKKALPDERLKKMKEYFKSAKVTSIQVEYIDSDGLKNADAIVANLDKKLDLVIADMEVLERWLEKELLAEEKELLLSAQKILENEQPLGEGQYGEKDLNWFAKNNFVTAKPTLFIKEEEVEDIGSVTKRIYEKAGMISFLTGGPKDTRAWELKKDSTAVEAADCIHSDIARGFIRAEVMPFVKLDEIGHYQKAKSEGCIHSEGKEYIVLDGDIIDFKFSV